MCLRAYTFAYIINSDNVYTQTGHCHLIHQQKLKHEMNVDLHEMQVFEDLFIDFNVPLY